LVWPLQRVAGCTVVLQMVLSPAGTGPHILMLVTPYISRVVSETRLPNDGGMLPCR